MECGLIVHPSEGFLVASPDVIVLQGTNIDETGHIQKG